MSLRFHEIAEANHRILNPFTPEKLSLLGEICKPHPNARMLDLACGKGELLVQWATTYGINGTGVDISHVFIQSAQERSVEMGVDTQLEWVIQDAGTYQPDAYAYDMVSCIGATWIGGGLVGTLKKMLPALKLDGGLLLVGEVFWHERPPAEVYKAYGFEQDAYGTLVETLDRFESSGLALVEMVLATQDSWDRYEASQWIVMDDYLRQHPDDPEAEAFAQWVSENRRVYLTYGRHYLGWGVFVLRRSTSGMI